MGELQLFFRRYYLTLTLTNHRARAYIALIVLATVSMAWYKILEQRYPLEYLTCHLYFLLVRVYTEKKIQVTRGIFHGKPLESVE